MLVYIIFSINFMLSLNNTYCRQHIDDKKVTDVSENTRLVQESQKT